MQEVICNRLRPAPPELKGEANASAGRGRDHAGGIADEQDAGSRPWAHEAAGGNASGAMLHDAGGRKSEHRLSAVEKTRQTDAPATSCSQSDLCHLRPRRHPREIARGNIAIQKAVQEAWVGGV